MVFQKGSTSWNKGLTKETDERVRKYGESLSKTIQRLYKQGLWVSPMKGKKGHPAWNKGLKGIHLNPKTEFKKGNIPWNKGLTKKTDSRIQKSIETWKKGNYKIWNQGSTKKTDVRIKQQVINRALTMKNKYPNGFAPIKIFKEKKPEKYNQWVINRREQAKQQVQNPDNNFGKKGNISWLKGKHICTNTGKTHIKKKQHLSPKTEFKKGHKPWSTGLTKETDGRLKNVSHVAKISRMKQGSKHKDTGIELALDKALEELGVIKNKDYVTNKGVLNTCLPDKVFEREKVAVFCDGDYWHANPKFYDYSKLDKIQRANTRNDIKNDKVLKENNWIVLRFWGEEILENPRKCALVVKEAVEHAKLGDS